LSANAESAWGNSIAVMLDTPLRVPNWLRLALAVVFGTGAAFFCMVYVANGMVVGDLIGLSGRGHDIAIAQHRSSIGLLLSVLFQFGAAGALLTSMDSENGYRAGQIFGAVLVSLAVTLACGAVLFLALRAFLHHS
jgi:hypothetical protein